MFNTTHYYDVACIGGEQAPWGHVQLASRGAISRGNRPYNEVFKDPSTAWEYSHYSSTRFEHPQGDANDNFTVRSPVENRPYKDWFRARNVL